MEVDLDWQDEVREAILAVTEELDVRASRYGPVVDFRPVKGGLGRLCVQWYDGILRYAFAIEWPTHKRPTVEYMRVLARAKIEQTAYNA